MEKKLPEGWEWRSLDEVLNVVYRYPTYYGIEYENIGVPEVRGELLLDNGEIENDSSEFRYISPRTNARFPQTVLKEGDLVISVRGTIGKVGLVRKSLEGANITANLIRLSPKAEIVSGDYLKHLLLSCQIKGQLDKLSASTTIKTITAPNLKSLRITVPPLETQRKIVAILEKAEETKRLREKSNGLTQKFLENLFLEMFGDPMKNPKGWDKEPLDKFGTIITGNTPSRDISAYYGDYIEWIKSDNINTPCTFLTRSREMLSKEGARVGRIAPSGSILVSCIAGSVSCIGNAAIADRDVAFNQQINAIVPNDKIDKHFLYHLIKASQKVIQDLSTQSMKRMVSKSDFKSIKMIMPPKAIQNTFSVLAQKVEAGLLIRNRGCLETSILHDLLMKKAFLGELVV